MKNSIPYNPAQEKAIAHRDGPMIVLAGPGSGKTAVITGRLCRLIEEGVSPYSILVVTFTRAAAGEMKERFRNMVQGSGRGVTIGTFHSVFYGIIRNVFHLNGSNILDGSARARLLKELSQAFHTDSAGEADLPEKIGREISLVKGNHLDPEQYYSTALPGDAFRELYRQYEKRKRDNRKIDFDDIIYHCWRLFRKRPDILKKWQQRFRYIMVDEFQDISPMQYEVVRMLAAPENNLFIVGDDDQSIYRFRGANPSMMLNFRKQYPDAGSVLLNVNYRCSPQILGCASRLIGHNGNRFRKKLEAASESGDPVAIRVFQHPGKEAGWLSSDVRTAAAGGEAYEEMAVLFRTNAECRAVVERFLSDQIPFHASDVIPCVFDHWIAKCVMAYLHLGHGSRRRSDFLEIYNKPNRYLSRDAFRDREISFHSLYDYYEDREWMMDRIESLEVDLSVIGRLAPYGAVQYIRNQVRFENYVKQYAAEHGIPEEELISILDELSDSARECRTLEEWEHRIGEYRETVRKQAEKKDQKEGVTIATLHASKGTEFDSVYIMDVNDGIIPYRKAVLKADIEEERRLLYVGMTRARKHLTLCTVKERHDRKVEMSPFLLELQKKDDIRK